MTFFMRDSDNDSRRKRVFGVAAGVGGLLGVREAIARRRETDLKGKVALITGGSRGLGLALARELAEQGCRIAICARDADELARAEADLRQRGAETFTTVCDVADRSAVEAMVAAVTAHYGRIDLLFAVAGIMEVAEFATLAVEDFEQAMDIMFWGVLYPTFAVLPQMRERGAGHIAVITSIGGKIAVPHLLPYAAAKFAAVGFSSGLSAELAREGIAVSTVVPGLMRTGSHLHAFIKGEEEQREDEYTWFSLGATNPFVPRADRAARIIVRGVRRGKPEITYTLPFDVAGRVAGAAPSTTIRLARVANALLPRSPRSDPGDPRKEGGEVAAGMDSKVLEAATKLGDEAARDFNQTGDPMPPSASSS